MKTKYLLSLAAAAVFGLSAQAQTTADLGASAQIITAPEPASIGIVRNASFGRVAQSPTHRCIYKLEASTERLGYYSYSDRDGSSAISYDLGFDSEGCGKDSLSTDVPIVSLTCAAGTSFVLNAYDAFFPEGTINVRNVKDTTGTSDIKFLHQSYHSDRYNSYGIDCGGSGTVSGDFLFETWLGLDPNDNAVEKVISETIPLEIVFE